MSKQHRRTWQRHEQRVAEALGTQRTGNQGAATADVVSSDGGLVVECKSWQRLPVAVVGALEQSERAAGDGQLAIAVLHQVGQRSDKDLVVLRWAEFRKWFGIGDGHDHALVGATDGELAVLAPDWTG